MRELYRLALRALPRWLREKHGERMEELFVADLRRARERGGMRGAWGTARVSLAGIADALARGLYERWQELRRDPRTT